MSSSDRKLLTIGPDDIAAVTAVGQAGLAAGNAILLSSRMLLSFPTCGASRLADQHCCAARAATSVLAYADLHRGKVNPL